MALFNMIITDVYIQINYTGELSNNWSLVTCDIPYIVAHIYVWRERERERERDRQTDRQRERENKLI